MFYELLEVDILYIIVGLARSGNHLFVSWLISGMNSVNDIVYLNNVKIYECGIIDNPICNLKYDEREITKGLLKYRAICRDNKIKKFDDKINKKLATRNYVKSVLDKEIKKTKCVIVTLENKESDMFDVIEQRFKKAKKIYKVIVIRDYFNLIASRLETEQRGFTAEYDEIDENELLKIWMENYMQKRTSIVFNYNMFVCSKKFQQDLASSLSISSDSAFISVNLFGRTRGSSFEQRVNDVYDYMFRFVKYSKNKVIRNCLDNQKLLQIICKDFNLCIEKINNSQKCGTTCKYKATVSDKIKEIEV